VVEFTVAMKAGERANAGLPSAKPKVSAKGSVEITEASWSEPLRLDILGQN
jgi:hypothetical protein